MRGLWGPMKVFTSYWELIWRRERGTAWLLQLSFLGEKKNSTSREKQAGLYQGKYKSLGPDVAAGGRCQKGATLTDTQQSPVIPETCGSCKNNPPHPHEPLPLSSHTAQSSGSERCVFSWGCPHDVCKDVCLSVCVCRRRQGLFIILVSRSAPQHCNWYWFRWDLVSGRCCFSDQVCASLVQLSN